MTVVHFTKLEVVLLSRGLRYLVEICHKMQLRHFAEGLLRITLHTCGH